MQTGHIAREVVEWVEKSNADPSIPGKIILEVITEGLTPIMQVPDVVVNKVMRFNDNYDVQQARS